MHPIHLARPPSHPGGVTTAVLYIGLTILFEGFFIETCFHSYNNVSLIHGYNVISYVYSLFVIGIKLR